MKNIVVVGGGPVGMTSALLLKKIGVKDVTILEKNSCIQTDGSRAIVYHKSTLDIFRLIGCYDEVQNRSVMGGERITRVGDREISRIDLNPGTSESPTFLNLPQFELESIFYKKCINEGVDFRFDNEVKDITSENIGVNITTNTGNIEAKYVIAADGCRSQLRKTLGVEFPGRTDSSTFVIVDIHLPSNTLPRNHTFTFNPKIPGTTSMLTVPQPNNIRRLDWQLHPSVQVNSFMEKGNLHKIIEETIGSNDFSIERTSHYKFHMRLVDEMNKGNIFFVGDAAHLIAPFGGRGMNAGMQDALNITWKLAYSLAQSEEVSTNLLNSYQAERWQANKRDQIEIEKSMQFISPQSIRQKLFKHWTFAKTLFGKGYANINSGKMSQPFAYSVKDFHYFLEDIGSNKCMLDVGIQSFPPTGNFEIKKLLDDSNTVEYFYIVRPDGYIVARTDKKEELGNLIKRVNLLFGFDISQKFSQHLFEEDAIGS